MASEIHIRISEEGLKITDEAGNLLTGERITSKSGDWPVGQLKRSIGMIGRATWITGSPICVWHDSMVY